MRAYKGAIAGKVDWLVRDYTEREKASREDVRGCPVSPSVYWPGGVHTAYTDRELGWSGRCSSRLHRSVTAHVVAAWPF